MTLYNTVDTEYEQNCDNEMTIEMHTFGLNVCNWLMMIDVNVYDSYMIDIAKDSTTICISMLDRWMNSTNKIGRVMYVLIHGAIATHD